MMSLITLSTVLSMMLLLSSNPVMILIIILIQTLFICLMIWISSKTSWFSFILFLIFLGGLMVLFIYVVSLASNEKFEINYEELTIIIMMTTFILFLSQILSFFFKSFNSNSTSMNEMTMLIFSNNIMILTTLIMSYLLFTLIVAVKISSKFEGPLRSFI